jgi:hypothetical protein
MASKFDALERRFLHETLLQIPIARIRTGRSRLSADTGDHSSKPALVVFSWGRPYYSRRSDMQMLSAIHRYNRRTKLKLRAPLVFSNNQTVKPS